MKTTNRKMRISDGQHRAAINTRLRATLSKMPMGRAFKRIFDGAAPTGDKVRLINVDPDVHDAFDDGGEGVRQTDLATRMDHFEEWLEVVANLAELLSIRVAELAGDHEAFEALYGAADDD